MREFLYGRQPVRECLRARRRHIHTLLLTEGIKETGIVAEIVEMATELRIPVERVNKGRLDKLAGEVHQGVAVTVSGYPYVPMGQILARSRKRDEPSFCLALDHVQDPHNLGALLRTAEGAGVDGVFIPERRAVGVTPAVVSASAGASEHVLVCQVTNLVRTIEELKKAGLWAIGLDNSEGSVLYTEVELDVPLVLVVGAEGVGLSRLVASTSDILMRLPMRGKVESLNASVAGALALYAVLRDRGSFHGG
jgi:23S rRNA (guanosine2251-2'-O)-methyltransferase